MNKKNQELFTIPTKELKDKISVFLEEKYGNKFIIFKELIKKYIINSLIENIVSKEIIINLAEYEKKIIEKTNMPTEGILFYLYSSNSLTNERDYEFDFSVTRNFENSILSINYEYLHGTNHFEYRINKNINTFKRIINMSDTYSLLVKQIENIIKDKIELCFNYASAYVKNKENADEQELEKELVLLLADQDANKIFKEANNIEN